MKMITENGSDGYDRMRRKGRERKKETLRDLGLKGRGR